MPAGQIVSIIATAPEGSQQIQIAPGGSTIVNVGTATITISTTATFSTLTTWTLDQHAAMPWPVGPLYVKSASNGKVLVVNKLLNLSIPKLVISSGTVTVGNITGTVKVTVSGGNLTISGGTLNIGSVTDTVTVGGSVTSLQQNGAVYATGNRHDLLYNNTWSTAKSTVTFTIAKTKITNTYGALLILVQGPTLLCAHALSVSQLAVMNSRFVAPGGKALTTSIAMQCQAIVPGVYNAGVDQMITLYFASADVGNVTVFGLTKNPGVQLRPDGRSYPIGSRHISVGWFATSTLHTIITAPTSPLRIMVRSIQFFHGGTVTGNQHIIASTGSVLALTYVTKGPVSISRKWDDGFLLDSGATIKGGAFTGTSTGQDGFVTIDYTLVV